MQSLLLHRKTEITGLPGYDAMLAAIEHCYEIDEAKEIRDQAKALEAYAKEALNTHAERKAIEIRIRAERKAGQLLRELERGKHAGPGRGNKTKVHSALSFSEYAIAKTGANISDDQAKRWQKLAEMPDVTFNDRLADPSVIPSTSGLIDRNFRQAPNDSLWFWGRLRDFEREGFFEKDINFLVSEMSDALQSDVSRIVPQLKTWLGSLEGEL